MKVFILVSSCDDITTNPYTSYNQAIQELVTCFFSHEQVDNIPIKDRELVGLLQEHIDTNELHETTEKSTLDAIRNITKEWNSNEYLSDGFATDQFWIEEHQIKGWHTQTVVPEIFIKIEGGHIVKKYSNHPVSINVIDIDTLKTNEENWAHLAGDWERRVNLRLEEKELKEID